MHIILLIRIFFRYIEYPNIYPNEGYINLVMKHTQWTLLNDPKQEIKEN
jgi:hypothetical protein